MDTTNSKKGTIKQLQHYNIFVDCVLGKGAYGCVYQGEDTKNKKQVAIKAVSFEKFKNNPEKILPILKNEIKSMQMLRHRHIVQLYNIIKQILRRVFALDWTENNLYMIVEHCNGGSLETIIRQKNTPENKCSSYMCQIIEGFKCLRENNIVHRDLKPENLLIHDKLVKIADFGFSKVVETGMDEPILLSFVGTPFYMSPQVLQKQNYSSKTDIWSLGMIFYELLYGKRAWEGKAFLLLLENVLSKPLIFPALPKIRPQIRNIISRMLTIKEEERISWEELFSFFSAANLRTLYAETNSNNQEPVSNALSVHTDSILSQPSLNKYPSSPSPDESQKSHLDEESDRVTIISASSHSNRIDEESESFQNSNQDDSNKMNEQISPKKMNHFEAAAQKNILKQQQLIQQQKQKAMEDAQKKLQQQQQQLQPLSSIKSPQNILNLDEIVSEQQMSGLLAYFNSKLNYAQHLQLVIYMQQVLSKKNGSSMTMRDIKELMSQQFVQEDGQPSQQLIFPVFSKPLLPLSKENLKKDAPQQQPYQQQSQQEQDVKKQEQQLFSKQDYQFKQQQIQQQQQKIQVNIGTDDLNHLEKGIAKLNEEINEFNIQKLNIVQSSNNNNNYTSNTHINNNYQNFENLNSAHINYNKNENSQINDNNYENTLYNNHNNNDNNHFESSNQKNIVTLDQPLEYVDQTNPYQFQYDDNSYEELRRSLNNLSLKPPEQQQQQYQGQQEYQNKQFEGQPQIYENQSNQFQQFCQQSPQQEEQQQQYQYQMGEGYPINSSIDNYNHNNIFLQNKDELPEFMREPNELEQSYQGIWINQSYQISNNYLPQHNNNHHNNN